jgi:hypothetical protein
VAVITALVKNSGNVGLAGQTVVFSSTSGALLAPSAQTDSSGVATVNLSPGSDKSNRTITVTAAVGTVTGSVDVPVVGTKLLITGSSALQAGGSAVQYSIRALDSSSNPVVGASIAVTSSLGNALSSSPVTTDSSGNATFTYTPTTAGSETLMATGLGATATLAATISATNFSVLSPAANTSVNTGANQTITVRYLLSGVGVSGQTVSFATTRGSITASATTNGSGDASATLTSTSAGAATVTAQISGAGVVTLPLQFVATTPATISVQANPGAIAPNASGSLNQSTIEATVLDAASNPVANKQVNFTILADSSNGYLSSGTALTDSNGKVQVQFVSGATSTANNGVQIQAVVAASPAISATTNLTVNGSALFISIGFGNDISNLDATTYSKPFSVYVTDANGNAVGNQVVTLTVIPTEYYKGNLAYDAAATLWKYAAGSPTVTCANEDLNKNGVLDPLEDTNGDGRLTPGNIVVAAPGSVITDASGHALFALQYGEQFAPWATVQITARASVSGTQSSQSITFALTGSTDDFTSTGGPAGVLSPFGQSNSCSNAL